MSGLRARGGRRSLASSDDVLYRRNAIPIPEGGTVLYLGILRYSELVDAIVLAARCVVCAIRAAPIIVAAPIDSADIMNAPGLQAIREACFIAPRTVRT